MRIQRYLVELVTQALFACKQHGWPLDDIPEVIIENPRQKGHGDIASNIALTLAKPLKMAPRQIAEELVAELPPSKQVARAEIAGPGFINFFLSDDCLRHTIALVLGENGPLGELRGEGSIHVEFVSANPTGPLHVGHGRGAAFGASLANVLAAAGHEVHREYYVNDAGRQMDILAVSVWLRYLELSGDRIELPARGYQGDYVLDIARRLREAQGDALRRPPAQILADLPPKDDEEGYIDALIQRTKELLESGYRACFDVALEAMVEDIRSDLADFRVEFDHWFSERSLVDQHAIEKALSDLRDRDLLFDRDGATWFRATDFGDDKDRVVVRENGQTTYFASDVAYLRNKLVERGFDRAFYVLGADHAGYVTRLRAAASGLGLDADRMAMPLIQFAVLMQGGEKVQMSTRSGKFVTLRQLREEVGTDAARFFYVQRSHEQHLEFDLDLAREQSAENPVYYIQYAHARIASILREATDRGREFSWRGQAIQGLENESEKAVLRRLLRYADVVEYAAQSLSVHAIPHYLHDLAQDFSSFYSDQKVLVSEDDDRRARLALCAAVQRVLAHGLALIGVSSPEEM